MKKFLFLVFLILTLSIFPTLASTSEKYRNLFFSDGYLDRKELSDAILAYMLDEPYKGEKINVEWLRDASHVYVYWNGNPKKIYMSDGREKVFYKPIRKIIPLNPSAADAIRVLGASNLVVGIETATVKPNYLPEYLNLPLIGPGNNPNFELIFKLDPDVVIAYVPGVYNPGYDALEAQLEPKITVVRLDFYKPETIEEEMLKLGELLGKEERARDFIEWRKHYFNIVKERIKSVESKPRVFIDYGPGRVITSGRLTVASNTGLHQLVEFTGGINVGADLNPSIARILSPYSPGYYAVDYEWIISQQPEIIIGQASGLNSRSGGFETNDLSALKDYYNEIISIPGIENTPAVQNKKIYIIHGDITSRLNDVVGLLFHAKWFHPDLFSDIEPLDVLQEYIDKFTSSKMNVRTQGIYVYHPELHPNGR
ncbi:MAG: ABC transporter substrate-binding protein [Archaeoglobaceae archaeon]